MCASRSSGAPAAAARTLPGARLAAIAADWSLALPLILVAGTLLVAPCLAMVRASFADGSGAGFTLHNWVQVVTSKGAQRAIGNSLALGATVATIALFVGAPLAWIISRLPPVKRALHLGLLNVATNFSGIGIGFAYIALLGSYGMVTLAVQGTGLPFVPPAPNSFWGLVLAYEYGNVPMFVLFSLPAMGLLRDEWWEAARTCASNRLQFWRHVGWPVLSPFLLAAWLLIFTWSVGMYGVPVALVGGNPNTFPLITVDMSRTLLGSLFGSQRMPVMAVILMIVALASLVLYRLVVRRATKWLS